MHKQSWLYRQEIRQHYQTKRTQDVALSNNPTSLTFIHHVECEDGTVVLAHLFGVLAEARVLASVLEGHIPDHNGHVVCLTGTHKCHTVPRNMHVHWLCVIRWDHGVHHLIG